MEILHVVSRVQRMCGWFHHVLGLFISGSWTPFIPVHGMMTGVRYIDANLLHPNISFHTVTWMLHA